MERAVKEDVRHVIEQAPLCAVGPYAAPLLIWARLAVESGFSVPRVGGQVIFAVGPELGDYAAGRFGSLAASIPGGRPSVVVGTAGAGRGAPPEAGVARR